MTYETAPPLPPANFHVFQVTVVTEEAEELFVSSRIACSTAAEFSKDGSISLSLPVIISSWGMEFGAANRQTNSGGIEYALAFRSAKPPLTAGEIRRYGEELIIGGKTYRVELTPPSRAVLVPIEKKD